MDKRAGGAKKRASQNRSHACLRIGSGRTHLELINVVLVGHDVKVVFQRLQALALVGGEQPVIYDRNAAELNKHGGDVTLLSIVGRDEKLVVSVVVDIIRKDVAE